LKKDRQAEKKKFPSIKILLILTNHIIILLTTNKIGAKNGRKQH